MGRITRQQVRVFALFSVAFLMTGYAFAYSFMGQTLPALLAVIAAVALMAGVFKEATRRTS